MTGSCELFDVESVGSMSLELQIGALPAIKSVDLHKLDEILAAEVLFESRICTLFLTKFFFIETSTAIRRRKLSSKKLLSLRLALHISSHAKVKTSPSRAHVKNEERPQGACAEITRQYTISL
jgi:hypothetical protein